MKLLSILILFITTSAFSQDRRKERTNECINRYQSIDKMRERLNETLITKRFSLKEVRGLYQNTVNNEQRTDTFCQSLFEFSDFMNFKDQYLTTDAHPRIELLKKVDVSTRLVVKNIEPAEFNEDYKKLIIKQ